MILEDIRKNIDIEDQTKPKIKPKSKHKKEKRMSDIINVDMFDEMGSICFALYKSKLVAMKRVYKTNVAMDRAVLKELKEVILSKYKNIFFSSFQKRSEGQSDQFILFIMN